MEFSPRWARALATGFLLAAGLAAQDPMAVEPLPREGDTVEWYVVEPGDTLMGITVRTLGTPSLWTENHRLNPGVRHPDLLRIGQRLRILTARESELREAEVTLVSRLVKTQRYPQRIEADARVGDLLKEKDGVRTGSSSSAELTFDPLSKLLIGERSLVILERVDSSLRGVRRESIEILRGEAEVEARPSRADSREIEILVGGARARPRVDRTGRLQVRSRRSGEEGGARVMVYGGHSRVEAAGAAVEVPRGMGTAVPPSGPPAPPEALLPGPRPLLPERSRWGYANPVLRWEPVVGTAAYTVEVCRDRGCRGLVERRPGVEETSWSPDRLPVGTLFWRVTAVSPSGLDGFPGAAAELEILHPEPDVAGPELALEIRGTGRFTADGVLLAAGAALEPVAVDDLAGVAAIRYRWDGDSWQAWGSDLLRPPPGRARRLEVQAEDHRGHWSQTWSGSVLLDEVPPEPPRAEWAPP